MKPDNSPSSLNIADLFFDAVKKYPNKDAIIHRDRHISFIALEKEVLQTAAYLLKSGISKGDRVMIFIPMSIELYRTVLAVFHIGATAVFLDEWVSKERMEACCKVAQCKAFIGGWKIRVLSIFSQELRKIPIKLGLNLKPSKDPYFNIIPTNENDTALITFTTGSTGIPKAANRTHGFLMAQFNTLIAKIEPTPNDIDMPVLPIVLLINLGAGCTSIITNFKSGKPETVKPEKVVAQLLRYKAKRMVASPFFLEVVADYIIKSKVDLPLMQKVFTGGGPVFPNIAAKLIKAFPQADVEIVYGSTEAEPISGINAKSLIEKDHEVTKGLLVGQPDNYSQVRIIKITDTPIKCHNYRDLDNLTLLANEFGEIIVSGNHVLRSYIANEAAIERNKIFINEDCWHRTGDSGYFDRKGNLYLLGRCESLIQFDGQTYSPFVFENYLQNVGDVEIGTIINMHDQLLAAVSLKPEAQKEAVSAKILQSGFPVKSVVFLPNIPRDPRHHTKIDYLQLKKLLIQRQM